MLAISVHTNKFDKKPILTFNNWKDFWKYINKEKFNETHTIIFANLTTCSRKENQVFKARKNDGFWIVELKERN